MSQDEYFRKLEKLKLLKQRQALKSQLPHKYGFKYYTWQREFIESKNHYNFLKCGNQLGKDLCVTSNIPTPSGFKKMGDIEVGDYVFGRDGKKTKVVDIPFIGSNDFYRITFNDETTVEASKTHLWITKGSEERFRKSCKRYDQWQVKTTNEIIKDGGYDPEARSNKTKHVIPMCEPVKYLKAHLTVEPYLLGLMIGNGSLNKNPNISCNAKDTDIKELKLNCLSGEKFIPKQYLTASVSQRKELLAGLMDTDGYTSGQHTSYATVSEQLSKDVEELVTSLGGMAYTRKKKAGYKDENGDYVRCKDCYETTIWLTFNPFSAKRKSKLWEMPRRYKHERVIVKIEPIGRQKSKCITVDNKDGSFLCTKDYIVTHNSIANGIKWVTWATEPDLWPKLWKKTPRQFWILMPSRDVINTEFKEKWEPEFLPGPEYKRHPQYGWQVEIRNRNVWAIHFNTGITCYMHTYEQDVHHLQAGTVNAHFIDEELPYDLYGELNMRLQAVQGYFNMVYTPTRGEPQWMRLWYKGKKETFIDAYKKEASLFDCLTFEDGSKSHWDDAAVNRAVNSLGSEADIQLRIFGKNSKPEGLKVPAFDIESNLIEVEPVPTKWLWYSGIDIGTGGPDNHPASISFIAIRPDYKFGVVKRVWRGGSDRVTGHSDIVNQWFSMAEELDLRVKDFEAIYYDWQAKDFQITATGAGLVLAKAEKSHEIGFPLMNTLFKNKMLQVDDTEENQDLVEELVSLKTRTSKTVARDDAIDAVRYGIARIPWNMEGISGEKVIEKKKKELSDDDLRRYGRVTEEVEGEPSVEEEIAEWNEFYEC